MLGNPSGSNDAEVIAKVEARLMPILSMLMDMCIKQDIEINNLRITLVRNGLISDAQLHAERPLTEKGWREALQKQVDEASVEAVKQMHAKLLERHKGEPQ